jgi:hypothetical protein
MSSNKGFAVRYLELVSNAFLVTSSFPSLIPDVTIVFVLYLLFVLPGGMMLELKPSDILYAQDSILNRFRDRSIRYIGETLDQLLEDSSYIQNIPNIEVVEINGKLFSMDNRRLWVYKKAEELGSLEKIDVIRTSSFNRNKFTMDSYIVGLKINPIRYCKIQFSGNVLTC